MKHRGKEELGEACSQLPLRALWCLITEIKQVRISINEQEWFLNIVLFCYEIYIYMSLMHFSNICRFF